MKKLEGGAWRRGDAGKGMQGCIPPLYQEGLRDGRGRGREGGERGPRGPSHLEAAGRRGSDSSLEGNSSRPPPSLSPSPMPL